MKLINSLFILFTFPSFIFFKTNYIKANESLNYSYEITYNSNLDNNLDYILGPGDSLKLEITDLPELSGIFRVSPNGNVFLPRLKNFYISGMTIEEAIKLLKLKYDLFLEDYQINLNVVDFRPVKVLVQGEVQSPGYYSLAIQNQEGTLPDSYISPKLFDVIQKAQGITPYSDLESIKVIRKEPLSKGGGLIYTEVDFLSFIVEGNHNYNINIRDGDTIKIKKRDTQLKENLFERSKFNLNPQYIRVYVGGGAVTNPGIKEVFSGASLNDIILISGKKSFHGLINFKRSNSHNGIHKIDNRNIRYQRNAKKGSYNNPLLANGDSIEIKHSVFSKSISVIGDVLIPITAVSQIENLTD